MERAEDVCVLLAVESGSRAWGFASPIVYAENPAFAVVRELAADCFSPVASAHHYLSMGRNHLVALNAWAAGALAQVTGALADVEPPAPVPWERLDEAFLALVGPAACRSMSEHLLHGEPVTDERIQMWADEAEAGYDPATLPEPRRGRPPVGDGPSTVVPVRFDAATLAALNARAQAEGIQNWSEAIRAAVRAWVHIA